MDLLNGGSFLDYSTEVFIRLKEVSVWVLSPGDRQRCVPHSKLEAAVNTDIR